MKKSSLRHARESATRLRHKASDGCVLWRIRTDQPKAEAGIQSPCPPSLDSRFHGNDETKTKSPF